MTKKSYILIALLISVILLVCSVGITFLVKACNTADAEYLDVLNDGNAIINFNQLINYNNFQSADVAYKQNNFYYINGNVDGEAWPVVGHMSGLSNGHVYYLYINQANSNLVQFIVNNSNLRGYVSSVITLSGYSSGADVYLRCQANSYSNYKVQFYLIDLTLMFGENNDNLTLEQCQDLFISDYYSYNTGYPMSLNGIEYYSQGVTDTYGNLGLDVVNYSAFSSAYIVSELSSSFPETFIERHVDYEVLAVPFLKARGVLGVPFNSIVKAGSVIKFKYIDPSMGGSGNYLWCGIYYNNSFVPIMRIDSEDTPVDNEGYITFACPFDTQNLLFCESSSSSEFIMVTSAFWLGDLQVQNAKMGDIKVLIDSAKQDAIRDRDEYWQKYYGQYGQGYQTIYNSGYNAGINADAQGFAEKYYTFPQFLGALFDVPVQTLTALLDFNVFGFNLKNFVFSLLTLAIIFALIKLILVKTGDK